jgi:hypothetical protein
VGLGTACRSFVSGKALQFGQNPMFRRNLLLSLTLRPLAFFRNVMLPLNAVTPRKHEPPLLASAARTSNATTGPWFETFNFAFAVTLLRAEDPGVTLLRFYGEVRALPFANDDSQSASSDWPGPVSISKCGCWTAADPELEGTADRRGAAAAAAAVPRSG